MFTAAGLRGVSHYSEPSHVPGIISTIASMLKLFCKMLVNEGFESGVRNIEEVMAANVPLEHMPHCQPLYRPPVEFPPFFTYL